MCAGLAMKTVVVTLPSVAMGNTDGDPSMEGVSRQSIKYKLMRQQVYTVMSQARSQV